MSEMIVKLNQDRVKIKGCEYVQDLIRCKDCEHWTGTWCWGIPFSGDDASYIETDANDFCSYAERKGANHGNKNLGV